jgi:hypothetical protein
MKLEELLEKYPWPETREALFRDPPARDELSPAYARTIIERQRRSQLRVLLRMLHGPVLEDDFPRAEGRGPRRLEPQLKLRDSKEAAQLFLSVAAQTGKALVRIGPEGLADLDPADGALGRLLLLLSITEALPWERRVHAHEWIQIARDRDGSWLDKPFGGVLTPMVFKASIGAYDVHSDSGQRLAEDLRRATDDQRVTSWARSLIEHGADRLVALSENQLPGGGYEQEETRSPEAARYTRDIRLVKADGRPDDFLDSLKMTTGVEAQSRFIVEEDPRFLKLRTWSAEPIDDATLDQLAQKAEVRIASATESSLA